MQKNYINLSVSQQLKTDFRYFTPKSKKKIVNIV